MNDAQTPVLWHIPLSHYNEKARWALDYKGVAHRRQPPGPNYLFRNWRATGRGTLPILWLEGRAIGDSTDIIAALEQRFPEPPLYPADPSLRQRALALEDEFDEGLGPALRAAIITPMFRHDPERAVRLLMTGMPDMVYNRLRSLGGLFLAYYRWRHKIKDANLEADHAAVDAALDRIEQERQGRRYMVGNSFTVADLTAAAMLGALIQPPELEYKRSGELPVYIEEYRAHILRHPAAQWALEIYRLHRGRSAELPRRSTTSQAVA